MIRADRQPLAGRVVRVDALDGSTRASMFALLGRHFEGVTGSVFARDLEEKTLALLLEDGGGVLRGFSTMTTFAGDVDGRAARVIYSGDTVVEPGWWHSPVLATTWLQGVRTLAPSGRDDACYWLLLTSGFRTYRFLPVFFLDFHPRFDAPAPAPVQAAIDALAAERFGTQYDARAGVVRFASPQVLRDTLRDVPPGRRQDPHVAYFLQRNPGYVRGDELVCLTRIADDNLTAAGRRVSRRVGAR